MVEAWALLTGLQIANVINISNLEVEIDNQDVYILVNNVYSHNHPFAMLISKCRHLFSSFKEIKLTKIRRSQNKCADLMAIATRKSKLSLITYVHPPPFVKTCFLEDINAP